MLPLDGVSWVETPGHPNGELENPLAAFPDSLASSGELQSISSILEELELVAANAKALPIPRPPSLSLAEFHYALDPLELMDNSADISHRILNYPLGPTPGSIEHLQYNDTENWADSHDCRLSGQITAHSGDFDNFLPKTQDDYWPARPPLNRRIADCRAPSPTSNIQESLFPNVARNVEPTRSKLHPLRNILGLKRTKRPADTNDLFDPTVNPYHSQTSRSLSEDGPASRSFLVF
ncbi:hypothetical protein PHLCEN_2v6143 [Hermanssonia centrifuga]|uniref:Uncharacterized protein n=1 Tax=Hermanssonia centrifuga TaxID=98765 RepID=A0A2R6P0X0_9APHY|nr:hypothetical protein PHLCEN_2v6143 [Hermanssonia centrifuga]